MNILVFLAGATLVVITAYDFFYTTLSSSGAGFITHRVTHGIWSFFLYLSKVLHSKKPLKIAGVFILLSTLILWLLLLWSGLYVMLISEERSVVTSTKEETAGLLDKIYYSGYVLSTMGNGDFKPVGRFWQILTSVFSFAGFVFITTAISYFVSVSSAIINKRTLSLSISNLGSSPQEILLNTWNGKNFSRLINYVSQLQQQLNKHTESHMAYPVLHFFHTGGKKDAVAINITNLDEALSILLLLSEPGSTIHEKDVLPLRDAVDFYLSTLKETFIKAVNREQALPDLSQLKDTDMKIMVDQKNLAIRFQQVKQRRMLLSGLLRNDGWSWKDIYA